MDAETVQHKKNDDNHQQLDLDDNHQKRDWDQPVPFAVYLLISVGCLCLTFYILTCTTGPAIFYYRTFKQYFASQTPAPDALMFDPEFPEYLKKLYIWQYCVQYMTLEEFNDHSLNGLECRCLPDGRVNLNLIPKYLYRHCKTAGIMKASIEKVYPELRMDNCEKKNNTV